tara:strand:+ start:1709 stop:2236 length:528 start_codon:yes stop_codon:yes gene_type:complete
MARYIKSGTPYTIGEVDSHLEEIEVAITDTLSRKGDTPNQMEADLDMNSKRVLNLPPPSTPLEPVRLIDVAGIVDITLRDLTFSSSASPTLSIDSVYNNQLITLTSATTCTITMNSAPAGTTVFFTQDTLSEVNFVAGVDITIKTPLGLSPYTQHSTVFALALNSTTWLLGGDLG